jgi:hypothetical protein
MKRLASLRIKSFFWMIVLAIVAGTIISAVPASSSSTGITGTVYLPPIVLGVSPSFGSTAGGTKVIITGTNFTDAIMVNFGTIPSTSFTVNSATQITAISPLGRGIVDITVVASAGISTISTADRFTYVSAGGGGGGGNPTSTPKLTPTPTSEPITTPSPTQEPVPTAIITPTPTETQPIPGGSIAQVNELTIKVGNNQTKVPITTESGIAYDVNITQPAEVTAHLAEGTIVTNSDGSLSQSIYINRTYDIPKAPIGGLIARAYDCGPADTTFDPPLTLTIYYSDTPDTIGNESNIYIAVWDGSEWRKLLCTIDTTNMTISTSINHFSVYALVGPSGQTNNPFFLKWDWIVFIIFGFLIAIIVLMILAFESRRKKQDG